MRHTRCVVYYIFNNKNTTIYSYLQLKFIVSRSAFVLPLFLEKRVHNVYERMSGSSRYTRQVCEERIGRKCTDKVSALIEFWQISVTLQFSTSIGQSYCQNRRIHGIHSCSEAERCILFKTSFCSLIIQRGEEERLRSSNNIVFCDEVTLRAGKLTHFIFLLR